MNQITDTVSVSSYAMQFLGKKGIAYKAEELSVAAEIFADHLTLPNNLKIEIVGLGKKKLSSRYLPDKKIIQIDKDSLISWSLHQDLAWAMLVAEQYQTGDFSKDPIEHSEYLSLELDSDSRFWDYT